MKEGVVAEGFGVQGRDVWRKGKGVGSVRKKEKR